MGVKIHYRGSLNNKNELKNLVNEVKDIAKSMGWSFAQLEEDWANTPTAKFVKDEAEGLKITGDCSLKGIHFSINELGDAIWLYFNANGHLSTPFQVAMEAEENYPLKKAWLATKTQEAGPDTHIAVIKLLKYLKSKYISNLEVLDNGGYWENEDLDLLNSRFNQMDKFMEDMDKAIEGFDIDSMDNPELIDKMIDDLLSALGENENAE